MDEPDRRPEEHTKASESVMVVMDRLSQNWNLKEWWSSGSGGEFREEWVTVATSWAAGATMRAAETATWMVMAAPLAAGTATWAVGSAM